MKKRGFTLVELLAVLVLISALTLIAVPSIINYINKSKNDISKVTEQLIMSGVDLYVNENSNLFPKEVGNQYCATLKDVVTAKYLSDPIMDSVTNKEIDLNKFVKINYVYDSELKINKFNYELTDTCSTLIKACTVISGDGTNVGDEVVCGSENFYVMSNDGNNITMLAKYNLKVGRIYTSGSAYTEIPTTEEGYGLQDSEMKGWVDSGYPYKGTVVFSSTNYWSSTTSSYPAFVYDSNSNLYQYVEAYETYLKNIGVDSADASLMSYEQATALGCVSGSCTAAPNWFYSTTYWTGSSSGDLVSAVRYLGGFYNVSASADTIIGVRPVVTVDVNQVKVAEEQTPISTCKVVSGYGTRVGDEIACGTENFYVMSNDGNNITMLAKYNLKVGRIYTSGSTYTEIPTTEEGYGLQDSEMKGWLNSGYPYKGTLAFSSTNYWSSITSSYPAFVYNSNSNLYQYVENYESYLKSLGVSSVFASLMSYEQIVSLGCSGLSCIGAPSWVYSTSYWLGSASSSRNVWIDRMSGFYNVAFSDSILFGVRPVVTISTDEVAVSKNSGMVDNFSYTGNYQVFIAPITGNYRVQLWGAGGGKAMCNASSCGNPGYGGYTSGVLKMTQGEKYYIYVGGKGTDGVVGADSAGGYNGGGLGTWDNADDETSGGGGGATDIRLESGSWNNSTGLASRIMVAGGGGGASYTYQAGHAGGLTGLTGSNSSATPGSQTTGYSFGKGQDGSGTADSDGVGGAGSGYWGGKTSTEFGMSSGTGGSSFISGHLGCIAVTSSYSTSAKCTSGSSVDCATHYSGKVFKNTSMISGNSSMPSYSGSGTMTGNSGNGYARITLVSIDE